MYHEGDAGKCIVVQQLNWAVMGWNGKYIRWHVMLNTLTDDRADEMQIVGLSQLLS